MILASILQDLRVGVRVLRKEKMFCLIGAGVLALGIGGVTTVFGVINGVLLRGMPFPAPERIVSIDLRDPAWPAERVATPVAQDFREWQRQQQTCTGLAAYHGRRTFNATIENNPERIGGAYVTHNFFSLLGIKPAHGRDFLPEDDQGGAGRVALISDKVWKNNFGGASDVVGRAMRVDGEIVTVIGVMPPRFSFPRYEEIWMSLFAQFPPGSARTGMPGSVIGRLKPAISLDEATVEFIGLTQQQAREFPQTNRSLTTVRIEPFLHTIVGRMRDMLLAMLTAAVVVLVIACVNVMNLQFARASTRSRELAVRGALGASRARLIRQMLTEGVLLVACGSLLGVALAYGATGIFHAAMAQLPFGAPPGWIDTGLDLRVLLFTISVGAIAVLGSSLVPAWLASRVNAVEVIKEGGHGHTNRRVNRLSQGLVVAQISLTLILLVAALLQAKSITKQSNLDLGYDPDAVMSARIGLTNNGVSPDYPTAEDRRNFLLRLLRELRSDPQFTHAALTTRARMVAGNSQMLVEIEGVTPPENQRGFPAWAELISDGYFSTLGITPRAGREFEVDERARNQPTVLVNESFARKHFGPELPLGRRLRVASGRNAPWRTIVGVVPDTLMQGPIDRTQDGAGVFLPWDETPTGYVTAVVRGHARAEALAEPLRRAVLRLDPNLPTYAAGTSRFNLLGTLGEVRVIAGFFTTFAVAAVLLATVGLYGLTSYAVSRRTQEFGIRMALGADRGRILRLVLRQGVMQFILGVVVGLALAAGLTQYTRALLADFLYKVHPYDASVYGWVVALLALASVVACLIPARRATRVEPVVALRTE